MVRVECGWKLRCTRPKVFEGRLGRGEGDWEPSGLLLHSVAESESDGGYVCIKGGLFVVSSLSFGENKSKSLPDLHLSLVCLFSS